MAKVKLSESSFNRGVDDVLTLKPVRRAFKNVIYNLRSSKSGSSTKRSMQIVKAQGSGRTSKK
jgi:hypothetical protein